ncbi:MAG: GNAT family N-acetyltransferase [Actinomycetes bacterium]
MTGRLEFRLLVRGDAEQLDLLGVDPDVLRFTRVPDPPPPNFSSSWIDRIVEGRQAGTREAFVIVENGAFVGIALAPQIDELARTAELGYVVMPAARGRGIATWALARLTEWAFDELGMLRCELLISCENLGSKRVAERCGYVLEGVLRSKHVKQNLRDDTEIWSCLPSDR